jgi:hypothetical protein
MANNTSTFTLKLKTEGMDQAQAQSQKIRDNLEGAQKAASGTSGSRRFASSAAAQPTGMAGASAGIIAGQEVETYNRARGAAGAAGGTARDFADQARGLGGLVRLYATFAANIFAATAAFGALSRAMDTTNMIQGLDQLGAASGRNLGTLSKNLAAASDGAISLRDAMEATAKASAAGLTNKQIEQIGQSAKQASLALGLNMPDALSRLSRGIAKIEPELLDELGLFVKLDDATEMYARKLGKTSSSLTEFERRQAFATAVLEQANQKFGNIDIDVNPYTKLLASLQNLLQTGLEFVNKVLGPIVKYLSESPVALGAVIAGIGITLLKQVMPVIGQWRQGLRAAAEDAADTAESIKKSFGDEFQSRLEARFRIPNIQKSLKETEAQIAKITSQQSQLAANIPRGLARSQAATSTEGDEKTLSTLNQMIATRQKYAETGIKDNKKMTQSIIQNNQEELSYLNRKVEVLKQELQLKTLIAKKAEQQQALQTAFGQAQIVADKPPGRFDPETIATKQYEAALQKRDRLTAVSNAAENARILGIRQSWALLNQEVAENGAKGFSKFSTLAQGGLSAIGARVVGLASSLGTVGIVLTTIVAGWEFINDLFSANKREAQAVAEGFDKLNQSAKFVDTVLGDISKKDPLARISVESINARATAFNDLAATLEDQLNKITKQVETANWWDKFIDGFKTVVDKDLLSTSAKELSFGVAQSFKLMTEGLGKSDAIAKFKETFKVDPTDRAAFDKLLRESPEKFMNLAPQVIAFMKQLGLEVGNVASKGKELNNAFDVAEKTLKDFITSSLPSDPVAKFGAQLVDIGIKLDEALKNPETRLAAIADIAKSITKQSMLGDAGKEVRKNSEAFLTAAANLSSYNTALETAQARQKELQTKQTQRTGRTVTGLTSQEKTELTQVTKNVDALKRAAKDTEKVINTAGTTLEKGATSAFEKGVKYIQIGISAAFAKAAITLSSAFAERLGDTEAGITRRAELEKRSNTLQISQLVAQKEMLTAQKSMQDVVQENTVATRLNSIELKRAGKVELSEEDKTLLKSIEDARTAKAAGKEPVQSPQDRLLKLARDNLDAQIQQLVNANKAIDIKADDQRAARRLKTANDIKAVQTERLNTELQLFDLQTKTQPYLTNEQTARKKILDDQILRNKQEEEYSNIQKEIDRNQRTLANKDAPDADKIAARSALETLGQDAIRLTQKQGEERKRADQAYYDFVFNNEVRKTEFIAEQTNKLKQIDLDIAQSRQDTASKLQEIELSTVTQTGRFTEEYLSKLKYEADVAKIVEESKRQEVSLTTQYKIEQERIWQQISAELERTGGEGSIRASALLDESLALEKRYKTQVQGIKSVAQAQLDQAGAINKAKQEQDSFNSSLNALKEFESVFPAMGTAVSGLVSALYDATTAQEKYNKSREDLSKKISSETDENKKIELTKDLATLDRKRAKDEISDNARLMGSVKNLFKEKTTAYKVFGALEKALHIARLAMDVKELVSKVTLETGRTTAHLTAEGAQTAATGAGFLARAGTYVTEIFGKITSQLGVFGPPVAAAIIAAIGLSAFGKGSKAAPAGFTAEEQQKVQGTGQTYRDGKLVEREGGVLGDPTARASSVSKSLELVSKNTYSNLEYSNKMVDALKSIEKNTRGLTSAMLRSLNPNAPTSLPGSIQQGQTRGNYISGGAGTALGAGLGYAGGLAAGVGLLSSTVGTAVMTGAATLLGVTATSMLNVVLPGIGLLLAKPLGKLMGSIFGGKTTKTIEDFGITVNGVLDDVIKGTQGVIEEWANVKTVRKGGWFRSDKTSFETVKQEASDPVKDLVGNLFMGVRDALTSAGEVLGKDVTSTLSTYLIKDFKISSKDLKPEELAQAIQGEISIAFNQMAMAAFPEFEQFAQPFEEAGETIVRLARQVQIFDLAMLSISKSVEGMSKMMKVEVSNALVELAGGIEKFIEQTDFFAENFLTEAERLAPVQESLTQKLAEMGLSSIDTRDEFKQLVLGLDLTNASQREMYNTLLQLAPAFAQVYEAANNASMSVKEFSEKVMGNEVDILRTQASILEGNKDFQGAYDKLQESLLITRRAELAEIEKLPEAQRKVLIEQAKYKYSLEDIANAAKLTEQINRQLIESYNKQITSQREFISYLDEALGLVNQALRLRGGSDALDAKAIERTITLQNLASKYSGTENEVRRRNIIGLQKYVWALEDEQAAKDKYLTALQNHVTAAEKEIAELQKTIQTYDKLIDQKTIIQELTASSNATAKAISRERELKALRNSVSGELGIALANNQEYIWALEDEKDIKDKLIEQRDKEKQALEDVISGIESAVKSLKDYRESLLMSSELSILTPEQQYLQAKTKFEETVTLARTPGMDEKSRAAQMEAVSNLPEVSNSLLELSRSLFASSGGYLTDFKVVQEALQQTESQFGEQLTDAQKQLEELKTSTKFLDDIKGATKTTAELLLEYNLAQANTARAAEKADKRSIEELTALKETAEEKITAIEQDIKATKDKIEELTTKTLTYQDSKAAVDRAQSGYLQATDASAAAYLAIAADVNNGTIASAIAARQEALTQIDVLNQQVQLLGELKNNMYGVYESQRQHFANLVSTPQEVNVGNNVAQLLRTIAANTAATADNVEEVKTAVKTGTEVTVNTNAANTEASTTAFVNAIGSGSAEWRARTNPEILSGNGLLRTVVTTQPD